MFEFSILACHRRRFTDATPRFCVASANCMQLKIVLRAGLPVIGCAVAFCANEVWNTKVSSHWTEADANLILNNSPWAKQVKTKTAQSGMARRPGGGRAGGMGGRRYPTGGGGGRGGGNDAPMSALVRWESA